MAMAIKAMVVAMVRVMGRPMVEPMPWIPMISRGMSLISIRGINQSPFGYHTYLADGALLKNKYKNFSLQSTAQHSIA